MGQSITIQGNMTRDPEMKYTADGMAIAKFGVAVNGFKKGEVEFFNCVAFRKTAEIIAEYGVKGKPVFIIGKQKTDNYEKDGQKKSFVQLVVGEFYMVGKKEEEVDSMGDPAIDENEEPVPF